MLISLSLGYFHNDISRALLKIYIKYLYFFEVGTYSIFSFKKTQKLCTLSLCTCPRKGDTHGITTRRPYKLGPQGAAPPASSPVKRTILGPAGSSSY
jgi:hypothetical protein